MKADLITFIVHYYEYGTDRLQRYEIVETGKRSDF